MSEADKPTSNYITNKELLLEIRSDLKALSVYQTAMDIRYTNEMGKRPSRTELISWLGAAGILSGSIFGILSLLYGG